MISGVSVLSARIPGCPTHINLILFWFDSEETVGMANTKKVSHLTNEELQIKAK